MAKVIVPGGPLGLQAFGRSERLSTIVSCSHYHPKPAGQDFAYTKALGQNLWLLGIDVWLTTIPPIAAHQFTFSVWHVTQEPRTVLQMYANENVLPVQSTTGIWYWHSTGPDAQFHWSMNKRFQGVGQRFGVVMTGAGAVLAQIHASFEIAEG